MPWPTLMSDASAGDVMTAANLNTLVDALQYLEGAWETETGTLDAVTTAPSTLASDVCAYLEIGKLMFVRYYFAWGASTNDGSGNYRVKVPNSQTTTAGSGQQIQGAWKNTGINGGVWAHFDASDTTGNLYIGSTQISDADTLSNGDWIMLSGILQLT